MFSTGIRISPPVSGVEIIPFFAVLRKAKTRILPHSIPIGDDEKAS